MFFYLHLERAGLCFGAMRALALHHLTAMDLAPADLVASAAAASCKLVTLFTYIPEPYQARYPLVTPETYGPVAEALEAHDVACHGLEVFGLTPAPDWAGMAQGLKLGGLLGAKWATVHVHCPDMAQACAHMQRLHDMAAQEGIGLLLEFNPYAQCNNLQAAVQLVEEMANRQVAIAILLDTLHAMRTGASVAQICAAASYIGGVQLSDGPMEMPQDQRWREAMQARLLPGTGAFPLVEMLHCLADDMVVDVEVPQAPAKAMGQTAQERVTAAVAAARAILERAA